MTLARAEFDTVLAAGTFESLVGELETDWFDAKSQPYQLATEPNRRELARDVAAFANVAGGMIILGLRTEPSATHLRDEVKEVRCFERTLVNTGQYHNILNGWIYPRVAGLTVEWLPKHDDPQRGLVVLRIPAQPADAKPFIVTKTVQAGKIVETMFGYAERRLDNNAPLGAVELQRALRAGLNFERTFEARLDGIEAVLREVASSATPPPMPPATNVLPARVQRILDDSGVGQSRSLVLSAVPTPPAELKTLFLSGDSMIRRKLEHPPALRSGGWDLGTAQSEIVRGEMVRSLPYRRAIELYRDGTLIFACTASNEFLAWTSDPEVQQIHPMALPEVILNFLNFYQLIVPELNPPPERVVFTLQLSRLHSDGIKTRLGPYGFGSSAQILRMGLRDAPADNFSTEWTVDSGTFLPERIAYELVREVYLWFGLEENKIPYTARTGGEPVVDTSAILKG